MKPDSMLVEPEHILRAHEVVAARGGEGGLNDIGQAEPALAAFLQHNLTAIAGKLALTGAPTPVVQGVHEDILAVVLICIQALRHGHYALWRDTMTGTRLAQLDEAFQPPPPRRRKKDRGTNPEK